MLKFYKALKDKKINMTKFINKVIQKKIAKFKYIIINSFWYEIDNEKDLKVLIEDLKKLNKLILKYPKFICIFCNYVF